MCGGCKNNWGSCSQLLGTDGVHKQLMAALHNSDQLAGFDLVLWCIDLDGCVEWQQCVCCAVHGGLLQTVQKIEDSDGVTHCNPTAR